jgi:DNA phosphorothioation-dependent restriction protein DptG
MLRTILFTCEEINYFARENKVHKLFPVLSTFKLLSKKLSMSKKMKTQRRKLSKTFHCLKNSLALKPKNTNGEKRIVVLVK